MATVKPFLGLGMAVVLLGIAGARLRFLYRVGASAQSVEPGRFGRTGAIARPGDTLVLSPGPDDASSSGAAPATTFKQ